MEIWKGNREENEKTNDQLGRLTKMIEYKKDQGRGGAKIPNVKVGGMTLGGNCKNDEMQEEENNQK